MHTIFSEDSLLEYFSNGYIATDITLSEQLIQDMKVHFQSLDAERNDYPQYFKKNEHVAYFGGKIKGALFNFLPKYAEKRLKKLYGSAYCKAVHSDQTFIERILGQALEGGLAQHFCTRYLIASYDIYLNNDYRHKSFTDVHSDIPNFHHFYETEKDVTIYIPMVPLNAENGGRLAILPETRANLKIPGNVLLKLMEDAFLGKSSNLDANGYIAPDRISDKDRKEFTSSKNYWEFLDNYNINTEMAVRYYMDRFVKGDWETGKIYLFTNKAFHAAETWLNQNYHREIYMIRLLPVYDVKINLRGQIHGKPFNRCLIDTHTGEVTKFDGPIDLSKIPTEDKLPLVRSSSAEMVAAG